MTLYTETVTATQDGLRKHGLHTISGHCPLHTVFKYINGNT